jgi:TolB-like protein
MLKKISLNPLFALLLIIASGTASAEEARIAVSAFQVNSKEDLGYIQSGLTSLLPPRISLPGKITVVDNSSVRRALSPPQADYSLEKKAQLTRSLAVDYLLTGSLTKFGDAISIDAFLYDAAAPEDSTPFSVDCMGLDNLIEQVQLLATELQRRILYGKAPEQPLPSPPVPAASPAAAAPAPYTTAPVQAQPAVPAPAVFMKPGPPVFNPEPSREYIIMHSPFSFMAAGDLTGRGTPSLLLCDTFDVRVYNPAPDELILAATIPAKTGETIMQIDTFDGNGNGRDEIYINSYTADPPNSFVAEYRDGAYVRIAENIKWFFRTYPDTDGSIMLLGMKPGTFNPFYGTAFNVIWKDGKPAQAGEFSLPGGVSPFGSSRNDIDGQPPGEFIAFSKGIFSLDYKLIVLTSTGRILWKDTEGYGGEPNSFERTLVGDQTQTREPIPQRIYCGDINGDRRTDIVLPRNTKKRSGVLGAMTNYNLGEMVSLTWDGSSLIQNWSSQVMDGYVSDFLVTDIDGDDALELVVLTVSFPNIIGKARNSIRIYEQTR